MAQPIALELPTRDPRQELQAKLERAPVEHAEALLESYELLQQLHDRHILEVLRGALSASDKLLESVVGAAESAESIRALRNMITVGKMLGSINPDLLNGIAAAVGHTLGSEAELVKQPPGLFALLSDFRHPELRRSITFINRFLEALGTQLKLRGDAGLKH